MTGIAQEPAPDPRRIEHFAANVAHDFNNLLTGILGNLELMQSRAKRSGETHFDGYLEGARNAGGRAATFAQRLLAYSGRAAQDAEPVRLAAIILEIVEPMREHGLRVAVAELDAAAQVHCDPADLELALHELLNNAVDATAERGEINLSLRQLGAEVQITVADSGVGMAPDILARAVEPFFTTRPNGAGKGLGLPIVDRFARQTGGALQLASLPDQGTTVQLILPKYE
ncbi:MAG: hypothetical protein B7Z80_17970 [Rhodospirillales bacterium 20-64-7]|nr:MAG: hypothetical protein B7Z80_17970 [Rhodospirillales bacterium 20-64-7]